MRFLRAVWWSMIAVLISAQPNALAQDLQVLVLDALNGNPQANVEVAYLCTGLPRKIQPNSAMTSPFRSITNSVGLALFANPCGAGEEIEISVYPPDKKEQCGDDVKASPDDIKSLGFISNPSAAGGIWCPTKISKTLKSLPGQITVFVKKPTWWQSHVAG